MWVRECQPNDSNSYHFPSTKQNSRKNVPELLSLLPSFLPALFPMNCFQNELNAVSDNLFFQNFLGEDTP